MRDYNFFSPYIYSKKKLSLKKFLWPLFWIILIAAISGTWFYFDQQINDLQEEYDSHQKVLDSSDYKNTMNEVTLLREKLAYLNALESDTVFFEAIMKNFYKVTDDLMLKILNAVPQNIVFNDYTITEGGIDISADTTDYPSIAEFEKNLRILDIFDTILVSQISDSEALELGYHFEIQMTFGGDDLD
jgi:Tfp pilus assembly protein PilN